MPATQAQLSSSELLRYARQILLPGWGEEAQLRLKASTVFIAGAGGLGSPLSFYLAAAGVGRIIIADRDQVELSNLNRQVLHATARIGCAKALSAARTLSELNPCVVIEALVGEIDDAFLEEHAGDADLLIDCLDNLPTRRALSRHCLSHAKPLLFGAIWGLEGRLALLRPGQGPCVSCLFPEDPPGGTFPVLGATPGVIGSLQAMEALKLLAGQPVSLLDRMLIFDFPTMRTQFLKLRRDPSCPACGPT